MTDAGRRPWIPAIVGGRYEIERELGSGAAAVTLLAMDRTLGRRVALKLLKPESEIDPEFTRRFSREARAAASVNHPNVVDVYDVGQDGALLYLVMQLVEGEDLKRLVTREGALPWHRATGIAGQILAGLGAIHRAGIVHRDIKPQNVLIGRDGSVRVTDFGVAHVELDSELTTAGTTVGTAAYMAPEQAEGRDVTPAADIYAVGVMLFEMVTGRVPFSAPTSMAVMLAHVQQPVPEPKAPPGSEPLPPGVASAIRQAMDKRPDGRFRSADAMRSALERPDAVPANATAQTQAVRSTGTRVASAASRPSAPRAQSAPRRTPMPVAEPSRGGGFSAFLVAVLVTLALGLLVAAGVLWYLDAGGGDGDEGRPGPAAGPSEVTTEEPPPTQTPAPTLTGESDEPGVIGPPDDDDVDAIPVETFPPTDTLEPTETPEPPPTPIPTEPPEPTETPAPIEPIEPEGDPTDPPNIIPIEPED